MTTTYVACANDTWCFATKDEHKTCSGDVPQIPAKTAAFVKTFGLVKASLTHYVIFVVIIQ